MNIEKKLRKDYFEKLMNGEQISDTKVADFEVSVGDTIVYKEWDSDTKDFTGREVEKEITDIITTPRPRTWTEESINENGFSTLYYK